MKNAFSNIFVITRIFTKYAQTNLGFYLLGVVFFPLSLLISLTLLVGDANHVDIFVGSMICSTTIMTISDISDIISHDKYAKSLSFFTTRPVKTYQYILGVGLSTLVYNLMGVLVITVAGTLLLDFSLTLPQMLAAVGIVIVGWFISSSLGFVLGMWGPSDPRTNTNLASMLGYVLTFLAPAYYPITQLSPVLQKISYLSYTTHLSVIAKGLIQQKPIAPIHPVILALYVLLGTIILFVLARWKAE